MTILAGIISRSPSKGIPNHLCAEIALLISRFEGDKICEFRGQNWYLAKVDIGAFEGVAAYEDNEAASMLAGTPLLLAGGTDNKSNNRNEDLLRIHRALATRDDSVLMDATGTFCGIHYDKVQGAVTIYADKFGVRPIYYWANERFVVYATALRILEGSALVPKLFNVRGVSEVASFGFPLAERTPYQSIATLRAGEVIRITESSCMHREYWRWDEITVPQLRGNELAEAARLRFMSAVRRRLGNNTESVAFLSGGLDSRVIVATLRKLGMKVHTLNFAPKESQDEVFGEEAARALGTLHFYLGKRAQSVLSKDQVYNQQKVLAWFDAENARRQKALSRVVWSGDGGSVGLGHVYLTDEIVDLAMGSQIREAIDKFLVYNKIGISEGLFKPAVRGYISSLPHLGIKEEIARLHCSEIGRSFHLFLMLNDQRRHMADVYENIDIGRLEFELPFFDSQFMSLIIGNPIKQFLRHEFYVDWLRTMFPEAITVPWQAYAGHVACPLPIPTNLRYQWGNDYHEESTKDYIKRATFDKAKQVLQAQNFPSSLMYRSRLQFARWLTRLGIRDYTYAVDMAEKYVRYWNICETYRLIAR